MSKSFYRKVGFGLNFQDIVPQEPLKWASIQLDHVPSLTWKGDIPTEKEMRVQHRERIYRDRKVLRKKYKND